LKRVIQKLVQDPLAEEILSGRVVDGATVNVDVVAGVLVFNGVAAGMARPPVPSTVSTLH
jgi:ATP-dependent Clp protease ATP-binding subunit ClpB